MGAIRHGDSYLATRHHQELRANSVSVLSSKGISRCDHSEYSSHEKRYGELCIDDQEAIWILDATELMELALID